MAPQLAMGWLGASSLRSGPRTALEARSPATGSPEPVAADSSHLWNATRGTTMRRWIRMAGSSPRRAAAYALPRPMPRRAAASSTVIVTRSTLLLRVFDQVIAGRRVTSRVQEV
jgi:hypothetical protein